MLEIISGIVTDHASFYDVTRHSKARYATELIVDEDVSLSATGGVGLFEDLAYLKTTDVSKLDTSNTKNLTNVTGIAHLDTRSNTDLRILFTVCKKLTSLDTSEWDMSNV